MERGTSPALREEVSLLYWSTAGRIHALLPTHQTVTQVFMLIKVNSLMILGNNWQSLHINCNGGLIPESY